MAVVLNLPQRDVKAEADGIVVIQRHENIIAKKSRLPVVKFKSLVGSAGVPADPTRLFFAPNQRGYVIRLTAELPEAG